MQIFLDCDGVLADFDGYAERLFGKESRLAEEEIGTAEFWRRLREHDDFFGSLPILSDGRKLHEAIAHLNPIILTGCPEDGWAEPQKVRWAARHFPTVAIITCMSRDKRLHMQPGDILVDDYLKYQQLWLDAGGIFIHHVSAEDSIRQLAAHGVDVLVPAYS